MNKPRKIKLRSGIRWEVVIYENGRGSQRIKKRFKKRIEAEEFIFNYYEKKKDGSLNLFQTNQSRTLKSEYEYWFKMKEKERSYSHMHRVQGIFRNLLKLYGENLTSDFTIDFLTEIRFKLLKDRMTAPTINRWMAALLAVINFSVEQRRTTFNPTAGFKPLKEVKKEMNFWEQEESSYFLDFVSQKYPRETLNRWKYIAYLIALNTGVRAGELWGIKVKDISFKRKTISINKQVLTLGQRIAPTKGRNSRKVPAHLELLEELKKEITLKNLEDDDLFFTTLTGNPIDHNNFITRVFNQDLKESGVRKIRFHDLRHSALTQMVDAGISIRTVQAIAGHADIKTTMRYVHALSGSIEAVANSYFLR